jgi:hypothetical protein
MSPNDTPMQAQVGGEGIAPTHSQSGNRRRWVVSTTLRPLYPRERPGTHCIEGWMGLGAGLDGTEILAPTGIESPDSPAHSDSLYKLHYLGRF